MLGKELVLWMAEAKEATSGAGILWKKPEELTLNKRAGWQGRVNCKV